MWVFSIAKILHKCAMYSFFDSVLILLVCGMCCNLGCFVKEETEAAERAAIPPRKLLTAESEQGDGCPLLTLEGRRLRRHFVQAVVTVNI